MVTGQTIPKLFEIQSIDAQKEYLNVKTINTESDLRCSSVVLNRTVSNESPEKQNIYRSSSIQIQLNRHQEEEFINENIQMEEVMQ